MAATEDAVPVWEVLGLSKEDFLVRNARLREGLKAPGGETEEMFKVLWSTSDDVTPDVVTCFVGWILAGEEPGRWLAHIKENCRSTICGHVFQGDEFVFKCIQCAKDPTSCMCAACFEKSKCKELEHQYQMFRSGGGGCCDCGDHEAWEPAGFCPRHGERDGDDEVSADDELSPGVAAVAPVLLATVLRYIMQGLFHVAPPGRAIDAGNYVVVLFNDEVHDMQTVERAIMRATAVSDQVARARMLEAHNAGHTELLRGEEESCRKALGVLEEEGLIVNLTRAGWTAHEVRATALMRMLREMCGASNVLRRMTCAALVAEAAPELRAAEGAAGEAVRAAMQQGAGRNLDLLMRFEGGTLWQGCAQPLHDLYIQLIGDEPFKNLFADAFVRMYPALLRGLADSKTEGGATLLDLSVQIFVVPTVVHRLVREHALLGVLFTALRSFFEELGDDAQELDGDRSVIARDVLPRIAHDTLYALRLPGVARALAAAPAGLDEWLALCARMQGWDRHTRATEGHVEYDARSWTVAFSLAMELAPVHAHMIAGYRELLGSHGALRAEIASGVLGTCTAGLLLWRSARSLWHWMLQEIDAEGFRFRLPDAPPADGGDAAMHLDEPPAAHGELIGPRRLDWPIAARPISFHFPLHRFLVAALGELVRASGGELSLPDVVASLLEPFVDADSAAKVAAAGFQSPLEAVCALLVEYPLRILVVAAQHQAGMWVRNGFALPGQMSVYTGATLSDSMFHLDMAALQAGVCLVGAEVLVGTLQDRFGLREWVAGTAAGGDIDSGADTESAAVLVAELLHLVIMLVSERHPPPGAGDAHSTHGAHDAEAGLDYDEVRSLLVHLLAAGPQTHSHLSRQLPTRISLADSTRCDGILREIATFRPPDQTQQGGFVLRPELLEEVSPFSWHLARKEREVVREAKRRHTPALPPFPPLRPCYRPLADALFSQALWRILRSVLRTSLAHASSPAAGGAFVTDAVIDCALHLVGLAAAAADADAASGPGGGEAWARLGTLCNAPGDAGGSSAIEMLARMAEGAGTGGNASCRFQPEVHEAQVRLLLRELARGCKRCEARLSDCGVLSRQGGDAQEDAKRAAEEERAQRQSEARERALAQMAAQQQAFAAMMDDEDEDADADEMERDLLEASNQGWLAEIESHLDSQCVLCHEGASSVAPLTLIAHAQTSTFVALAASRSQPSGPGIDAGADREMSEAAATGEGAAGGAALDAAGDQRQEAYCSPSEQDGDGETRRELFPSKLARAAELGWEQDGSPLGLAVTFCGHTMHKACLDRYMKVLQRRRQAPGSNSEMRLIEFPCPLCRSLGNNLVPILPAHASECSGGEASGGPAEPERAALSTLLESGGSSGGDGMATTREADEAAALDSLLATAQDSDEAPALASLSAKELRALAAQHNVDITSCIEKIDICDKLRDVRARWRGHVVPGGGGGCTDGGADVASGGGGAAKKPGMLAEWMACRLLQVESHGEEQVRKFEARQTWRGVRGGADAQGTGAPEPPCATACSAAAYSLFSAEMEARLPAEGEGTERRWGAGARGADGAGGGLGRMGKQNLAHLVALLRAVRTMVDEDREANAWRWAQLSSWASLLAGRARAPDRRHEIARGPARCLLEADLASLLVHWMLLLAPGAAAARELDGVLHILWYAQILQALLLATPPAGGGGGGVAGGGGGESDEARGEARLQQLLAHCWPAGGAGAGAAGGGRRLEAVLVLALPFLRRAALLRTAMLGAPLPPGAAEGGGMREALALVHHLGLPGACGIPAPDGAAGSLFLSWVARLGEAEEAPSGWERAGAALRARLWRQAAGPCAPRLVRLPQQYRDLLKAATERRCERCNTQPAEPALCLLCGALLCAGLDCCREKDLGECNVHAATCGGGSAVLLLVKQCIVLLLAHGRGCRHSIPYLDVYGEEDVGLRRGRPLHLSAEREIRLLRLWASHGLHTELARQSLDHSSIGWTAL